MSKIPTHPVALGGALVAIGAMVGEYLDKAAFLAQEATYKGLGKMGVTAILAGRSLQVSQYNATSIEPLLHDIMQHGTIEQQEEARQYADRVLEHGAKAKNRVWKASAICGAGMAAGLAAQGLDETLRAGVALVALPAYVGGLLFSTIPSENETSMHFYLGKLKELHAEILKDPTSSVEEATIPRKAPKMR